MHRKGQIDPIKILVRGPGAATSDAHRCRAPVAGVLGSICAPEICPRAHRV